MLACSLSVCNKNMFEEKDDTIMARWLANELTEAERIAFEASPEYEEYMQLKKGLQALKKPHFEKEALRAIVWQGIENQKPSKVIPLKRVYYTIGIAASILLLLGFFFNEVSYTSGIGEKREIELPDGTVVSLNAQTTLKRNRFFWNNDKEVELIGEAFFDVIKGEGFKVKTSSGTVSVLGTQFNVKARTSSFEVFCYEGKVRYDNPKEQQQSYLEAGDAVRLKDNILLEFKHVERGPLWQSGRSTFSNAEIRDVMQELEVYYGVSFDYQPNLIQGHYSGTFVHNNLELALKSVFVPMGLSYEISQDQKIVVLNASN